MRPFLQEERSALQRGERPEWERLCTELRPRLELLARLRLDRRLSTRVDPEDLVQELLLQLVGRQLDPGPSGEHLMAWLRTALDHLLVDLHRRHVGAAKRSLDREGPLDALHARAASAHTTPTLAARRAERSRDLVAALERMPADQRGVIVHRLLEERSVRETAQLLDRSEGAVSVLLNRALRKLRDLYRGSAPTGLVS
ncbi:MAG: hypothetical protein DHS20C15_29200 [Planctomycetota bacterium]|nr:MAG: hypothetical protein DHS20C15_29200 [Planctomycetota bacterium]